MSTTPGPARRGARLGSLLLGLALVAALILAACGTTASPSPSPTPTSTPIPSPSPAASPEPPASPTPSPDPATVYASIEKQVQALRGLTATKPVEPKTLDEAGLRGFVEKDFFESTPPGYLAAYERLYKRLDLLGPDDSLLALFTEYFASQILGFYSPDTKELYVVARSGGLGPTERFTFAHEFTHALQDQTFDTQKLGLDALDQSDRGLARLSLIEGDATLSGTYWATQNLTAEELTQMIREASDPKYLAALEKIPPIIRDTLVLPYDAGLTFVLGLQAAGGWDAVDAAFDAPPDSTEQILHPEKYASREDPIPVDFPKDLAARMGTGWTEGLRDTFGEFQLRVWLRESGVERRAAEEAAAGWGGDRVVILDGPKGATAVVIDTRWDSAADASEFAAAARTALGGLGGSTAVLAPVGGTRVTVFACSSATALSRAAGALGLAE